MRLYRIFEIHLADMNPTKLKEDVLPQFLSPSTRLVLLIIAKPVPRRPPSSCGRFCYQPHLELSQAWYNPAAATY